MKKYRSQVNTSMSREQMAITHNSFDALQSNNDFQAPLAWANKMIPSF